MADLTAQQRNRLPRGDFAIPEKAPGSGSYPIPDLAHARDALARSSGKPEEGRVRSAVHRKFPELKGGAAEKPTYDSVIEKHAARHK